MPTTTPVIYMVGRISAPTLMRYVVYNLYGVAFSLYFQDPQGSHPLKPPESFSGSKSLSQLLGLRRLCREAQI